MFQISTNIKILVSGNCLTLTPLSDVDGSVLFDDRDETYLTIPNVKGVTPLVEIQLTSNCTDAVENNRVGLFGI